MNCLLSMACLMRGGLSLRSTLAFSSFSHRHLMCLGEWSHILACIQHIVVCSINLLTFSISLWIKYWFVCSLYFKLYKAQILFFSSLSGVSLFSNSCLKRVQSALFHGLWIGMTFNSVSCIYLIVLWSEWFNSLRTFQLLSLVLRFYERVRSMTDIPGGLSKVYSLPLLCNSRPS